MPVDQLPRSEDSLAMSTQRDYPPSRLTESLEVLIHGQDKVQHLTLSWNLVTTKMEQRTVGLK